MCQMAAWVTLMPAGQEIKMTESPHLTAYLWLQRILHHGEARSKTQWLSEQRKPSTLHYLGSSSVCVDADSDYGTKEST